MLAHGGLPPRRSGRARPELERLGEALDDLDARRRRLPRGRGRAGDRQDVAALRAAPPAPRSAVISCSPARRAEFERDLPFGVWVDALDAYVASQELAAREDADPDLLADLAGVLPALRGRTGPRGPPPATSAIAPTERVRAPARRARRAAAARARARRPALERRRVDRGARPRCCAAAPRRPSCSRSATAVGQGAAEARRGARRAAGDDHRAQPAERGGVLAAGRRPARRGAAGGGLCRRAAATRSTRCSSRRPPGCRRAARPGIAWRATPACRAWSPPRSWRSSRRSPRTRACC